MRVILLQDVKKVGQRGTLATVADGYAQNVLLPKKLAMVATADNVKRWESEKKEKLSAEAHNAEEAKKILSGIDGKTVEVRAKANESGGLFKAVHSGEVVQALRSQFSISIPEDAITISEAIKKTGSFPAGVTFQGASAKIVIAVSKL